MKNLLITFLALISINSALARPWDKCTGISPDGVEYTFVSDMNDFSPETIVVITPENHRETIKVTRTDNENGRNYTGDKLSLQIDGVSCYPDRSHTACNGIAKVSELQFNISCYIDMHYTPARSAPCRPGIPCH